MLIGSLFLGKVHQVDEQWIETKFVVIGVPLFPTSSMLVTSSAWRSRNGFPIPLNQKSIIAGYGRIFSAILAFAFIGFFFTGGDVSLLILGACFLALWIYFFFVFGKADDHEVAQRKKLGSITGLYAVPEWLDYNDAYRIYERMEKKYQQIFDGSDWLADIQESTIAEVKLPLLYALSRYNYAMGSTDENLALHEKVSGLYQHI